MRSCVIGGGGFIGKYLVEQLIESGRDVVVLGRKKDRPETLAKKARYVSGNYGDPEIIKSIASHIEEVYDLAYSTVPKSSFEDPVFDILSNLPTSVSLFKNILTSNLKRIVLISSGGVVYGPTSNSTPLTEEAPTNPISPYGITKLAVEKYALMFHHSSELPVIIVRPSNAYGVGQMPFVGQGFIATAMGLAIKGEPIPIFGEHGVVRDYIHVKDLASGIIAASNHGQLGEIYNIGTGIGYNNFQIIGFLECIASAIPLDLKIDIKPQRAFDVSVNILNSKKLFDCSGWKPSIKLKEGMQDMWNDLQMKII